jgi:hypothetical protein
VRVFHYGWVREPRAQQRKLNNANRLYNPDAPLIPEDSADGFDYDSAYALERYTGSHPALMLGRIEREHTWTQHFDSKRLKPKPFLVKLTDGIERLTNWRIGEYKNFIES